MSHEEIARAKGAVSWLTGFEPRGHWLTYELESVKARLVYGR
jgi:hypothetical protein